MRITENLEGWSIQVDGESEVRFLRRGDGWTSKLVGEVKDLLEDLYE